MGIRFIEMYLKSWLQNIDFNSFNISEQEFGKSSSFIITSATADYKPMENLIY